MKKVLIGAMLVMAGVFVSAQAHCASKGYVGVQVGPEFVTDSDTNLDTAVALGVYAGYRIDNLMSLEANLTTADHDYDAPGDAGVEVTSILFGPRVNGRTASGVIVYAGAGLGIHFLDFEHRTGDDTETVSGIYMGAGMDVPLKRGMALGVDFKYHVLFDHDDLDSDIATVLIRLGFDL